MDIKFKYDTKGIDWTAITETLKSVDMASYPPEIHKKAFKASYCTIFAYSEGKMVGFRRAISDGAYQAAIYDCAVLEEYQGHGLGKLIVKEILANISGINTILYASPGKEGFYEKNGIQKNKNRYGLFC
ncbi:GNAT family N-acetyltransferase [Maridesulfovibrio sp.]|uniref:GNAT family N-acetyltransferase n=1 Tax=Maridesulfovibrio sp. TaxID=2795000 RepID=UPI002A187DA3|nr:GNAT family N-acetyltransferase [Maridesulfovibrio sp.]